MSIALADAALVSTITDWQEWLGGVKRYSPRTLTSYLTDIADFISFINRHRGELVTTQTLADLHLRDFRAWLAARNGEGKSATSNARAVSTLRNFFRYLQKQSVLDNPNIFLLTSPKRQAPLPKTLSQEETRQALETVGELSDEAWVAKRDVALLMIIYGCVLRKRFRLPWGRAPAEA